MSDYEIKRKEWLKDPDNSNRPGYFAPLSALRPISSIPPESLLPNRIQ